MPTVSTPQSLLLSTATAYQRSTMLPPSVPKGRKWQTGLLTPRLVIEDDDRRYHVLSARPGVFRRHNAFDHQGERRVVRQPVDVRPGGTAIDQGINPARRIRTHLPGVIWQLQPGVVRGGRAGV